MCVLFYASFVCIPAYANVCFPTSIIHQNIKITLIEGVPSSQALPGYLITAPPSVCVPTVIGVLAVWIQHPKKRKSSIVLLRGRILMIPQYWFCKTRLNFICGQPQSFFDLLCFSTETHFCG